MDPLDPLTEIINTGQAFSLAIILERIIWAIIGVLFIGAITNSIAKSIRKQNPFSKKAFFSYLNASRNKDDKSDHCPGDSK